jgi:hypothetical protein
MFLDAPNLVMNPIQELVLIVRRSDLHSRTIADDSSIAKP